MTTYHHRRHHQMKPVAETANSPERVDQLQKSKNRLLVTDYRHSFLIISTAVLLLAAVFRLVALQQVPPGLSQDEVLNADIVGLIRTGHHALFFREGFGHEPLYHYWATPFQFLLGDNVLAIRLPSVFLGLLLIAATLRWTKRDFGSFTAVVAGAGMAVGWWAVIFSRVGIRPIMQPLLWLAAVWFWQKRPWLAGLSLGLSLYTYTGAQVTFALPILFGTGQLLLGKDPPARRTAVNNSFIILAGVLLVSLPLYLTWRADPSLLQRVDQLAGPLAALQNGDIAPILQAVVNTLGVFAFTGDPRWTYILPGRPLFDSLTAMFFFAGLIIAFRRVRQPRFTLLLSLLLAGLLPSMLTPQSPSIIRMIGAMPAVYIAVGLSVNWLTQRSLAGKPRRRPILLIALLILLLLSAGRTWQIARAWSSNLEIRLNHYQTVFYEIGRHWQANSSSRVVVADTFFEVIDADSLKRNMGENGQARWIQAGPEAAGALVFPVGEDQGHLYVPEFSPLNPDLLAQAGMQTTPSFRSDTVPSFSVYNLPAEMPEPSVIEDVVFDGLVQLEGYTLDSGTAEGMSHLYTYWHVLQPLPWNLTAFVHLVDEEGHLVNQVDGLDAAPSQLQPGDRFIQRHPLQIPAEYEQLRLRLGLYTPDNGSRLLIDGESSDYYRLETPIYFDE